MPSGIRLGIDKFIEYKKKLSSSTKFGLITNQTGLTSFKIPNIKFLLDNHVNIKHLYSPEHGLFGSEWDTITVKDDFHYFYGKKVYSLFNERESINPDIFSDIDAIIFDIQDTGVRFYTYISTLYYVMEIFSELDKKLIVLDRPNPISGKIIEGDLLDKDFMSFFGVFPIKLRYGLTVGELAIEYNDVLNADLDIVFMDNWERWMFYDDTGLLWVSPSPCIPTIGTAIIYPGTALFEGTNLSEGRGTSLPFSLIGAPWIDEFKLKQLLDKRSLKGVFFREARFKPFDNKYKGETCRGVQIYVLDKYKYRAVESAVALLEEICKLHPDKFSFVKPLGNQKYHFDLLWGNDSLRKYIQKEFL